MSDRDEVLWRRTGPPSVGVRVEPVVFLRECAQIEQELRAENERLRADAERYRWLRECARATSEHWGGSWSLVIEGPAPQAWPTPASIDAAIDAAREAK